MTPAELDTMKWASWENPQSFWIQKEYLLGLLEDLGFDLVLEQFDWLSPIQTQMTTGHYPKNDRVMLVGIKSGRPSVQTPVVDMNAQASLEAVYRSTSWRVTAPLRSFGKLLGR